MGLQRVNVIRRDTTPVTLVDLNTAEHRGSTVPRQELLDDPFYIDNVTKGTYTGFVDPRYGENVKIPYTFTFTHAGVGDSINIRISDVNVTGQSRATVYVKLNDFILPLSDTGSYAFDLTNTPHIAGYVKDTWDLARKVVGDDIEWARMCVAFSACIAGLGGTMSTSSFGDLGDLGGGFGRTGTKTAAGSGGRPRYVPTGPDGRPLALPRGPNGELAPSSMDPHTQIGWQEGRRGGYVQTREFGPNGQPVRQVDWTDHGRPARHTDPHVHDYVPNPTGGTPQHGPARPPRPGEL
jgi:hypothetical protein